MAEDLPSGTIRLTLKEIAELVGGACEGPPDLLIERVCSAEEPAHDGIAFAERPQFLEAAVGKVGAILLPQGLDSKGVPCVRVPSPRAAFLVLLNQAWRPWQIEPGVHPAAVIHPTASVDPTASIGPFASVGAHSIVHAGAKIHAHAVVGDHCEVGADSVIASNATLVSGVRIGARAVIHASAVLGADGFGFVFDGQRQIKIPQVGRIEVGDDVEIGALTSIDRAMVGVTKIGNGSKLDNHVHIGHNCQIGSSVIIAGCAAMGGSCEIGDRVIIGGGSILSDHVKISSDIRIGGNSRVPKDLTEPGDYFGTPVQPAKEGLKNFMLLKRLDEFRTQIRDLERQIRDLKESRN